jgi:hypothetical protein
MQDSPSRTIMHNLLGVKMLTHTIVYSDVSLFFIT